MSMIRWWLRLPFGVMALFAMGAGLVLIFIVANLFELMYGLDGFPTVYATLMAGGAIALPVLFNVRKPWADTLAKISVPGTIIAIVGYTFLFVPGRYGGFVYGSIAAMTVALFLPYWLVSSASQIKESPAFRKLFSFGRGGNSRWAGLKTFKNYPAGDIYLGPALFLDDPFKSSVGISKDDDAHHVTLAATGSGKSVTAIWPTLMRNKGPMVVIDPKGEHAEFCSRQTPETTYRPSKVLDPYNQTSLGKNEYTKTGYNPLSEINIRDARARALIEAISSACVIDKKGGEQHFSEAAKTIIEGVIALTLATKPESQHNLPAVADLFRGYDEQIGVSDPDAFDSVIAEMSTCDAAGGVAMDAASLLLRAGDRERGSMLTTCFRSLKWVNDPPMRKQLSGGELSLASHVQAKGKDTLFIVLPFEYMEESSQIRWMRMMISLVNVHLFRNPRKGANVRKLTIIMDEFFKLGYMPSLEQGVVTARGSGAKWWILLQDIGQLKALYAQNWETFLGSSNVQVFGINDQATVDWTAKALGGEKDREANQYPLMRPDEVREFLGKDSPTQIVIPATGLPMRLERAAFKPLKKFRGMPSQDW